MQDDLYYRAFTKKSEIDKAISSLKGILLGIGFDTIINQREIQELNEWCANHKTLMNRNPFKELMVLIQDSIRQEIVSTETIEDLYWSCQKFENDGIYYNGITSDIQILHGVCHGIISDGVINDAEITKLDEWLEQNAHLSNYYPYDELISLVTNILIDRKITEAERNILLAFFHEYVKVNNKEIAEEISKKVNSTTISGICAMAPDITIENKIFALTGISQRVPRRTFIDIIKKYRGLFADKITLQTDYLIVCDNKNPCWAYSCYGRKVETAISYRKVGHPILIVHEFDFWDSLADNGIELPHQQKIWK
jgi:NAD-dependent DNA ligase